MQHLLSADFAPHVLTAAPLWSLAEFCFGRSGSVPETGGSARVWSAVWRTSRASEHRRRRPSSSSSSSSSSSKEICSSLRGSTRGIRWGTSPDFGPTGVSTAVLTITCRSSGFSLWPTCSRRRPLLLKQTDGGGRGLERCFKHARWSKCFNRV